jgi:hypothetical protein
VNEQSLVPHGLQSYNRCKLAVVAGSEVPAGAELDGNRETREMGVVREVVVDVDVDDREVVVVVVRAVTEVVSVHRAFAGQAPPFSSTDSSPVSCKFSMSSGYSPQKSSMGLAE